MLKGTTKSSIVSLKKILRESSKAAFTAVKNREIIETLISIQEIKSGRYKRFSSAEQMFQNFGI